MIIQPPKPSGGGVDPLDYLTKEQAMKHFLQLIGGTMSGPLVVGGVDSVAVKFAENCESRIATALEAKGTG